MKRYCIFIIVFLVLLFETGISKAQNGPSNKPLPIDSLINDLLINNAESVKETRTKLRQYQEEALPYLLKYSKSKDDRLRLQVIITYLDILLDTHKDPQKDALIKSAVNDSYYMVRVRIIGKLANSGHIDYAYELNEKIAQSSPDDKKIFTDIINAMGKKTKSPSKKNHTTLDEESYLVSMGPKINPSLENIIATDNEDTFLRKRLIAVYWVINEVRSNNYFLKVLKKTKNNAIKQNIIITLNNELNKKNTELINTLSSLQSKENDSDVLRTYTVIINDLKE